MAHRYYMLVASLPYLEPFERMERLPLTRLRLEQRLSALRPDHAADYAAAERVVVWQRDETGKTDADVLVRFRHALETIGSPSLRAFVTFRMDMRTVVAALRRRHAGEPVPGPDERWGTQPRADFVRHHWDKPDFGLGTRYRWIAEAARLLGERDALGLERLLMNVVWTRLGHVAESAPFGFEAVFAFAFRWDIATRWLSYQPDAAATRFGELVKNALGGKDEI